MNSHIFQFNDTKVSKSICNRICGLSLIICWEINYMYNQLKLAGENNWIIIQSTYKYVL